MKKTTVFLVCFLAGIIYTSSCFGEAKCIITRGEAAIMNNDVPSAKLEAVARAKWSAIEQVVGTEIKVQSLVRNFSLVEDAIKTQVSGVVKSFDILSQENKDDLLAVKIKACVEPKQAKEAVSNLALNNSVAVFIPARKPNTPMWKKDFEETNIFSETLIGRLTDQGYTVADVAPTQAVDAMEIERAIRNENFLALRSMMYKFFSNLIIIGKIDYAVSTKKGESIGYGISMPFNNVTVTLTYRIIAKNNKTGNMEILTAGTEKAKGMALDIEDATNIGLSELAEKLSPLILDKVAKYIEDNVKKITIKIAGIPDFETNMDIKETLQNIIWVTGVEEKEIGEFIVSYPENTIYLANSLKQHDDFKIVNFTSYSVTLDYQK
jgi:hypothetical protein